MHESRAPVDAAAQPVQRQVVGQVAALVLGGSEGLERGATAAHEVDIGEGARGGERRSVEEEHALLRARVGVRVRVRVRASPNPNPNPNPNLVEQAVLLRRGYPSDERCLERRRPQHHHLARARARARARVRARARARARVRF